MLLTGSKGLRSLYSSLCRSVDTKVPAREFSLTKQLAMIFRQLFDSDTCTYTYILGCPKTKNALIIDPVLELVDRDLKVISELKLEPKFALNTHVHADHITGSGQMKQKLGSSFKSVISGESGAKADIYLSHGETFTCGDLALEARRTPGHTNGCMTFVFHDQRCAFTGDAVLIRGCGRTDFQQGDPGLLYDSVHANIFSLPDDYLLYPAHDYTGQTKTSVGEEKEFNKRLNKSKEEFIEIMKNLGLAYPKYIDKALPANLVCGIVSD